MVLVKKSRHNQLKTNKSKDSFTLLYYGTMVLLCFGVCKYLARLWTLRMDDNKDLNLCFDARDEDLHFIELTSDEELLPSSDKEEIDCDQVTSIPQPFPAHQSRNFLIKMFRQVCPWLRQLTKTREQKQCLLSRRFPTDTIILGIHT